ncbi:MAG TPA: hypothetical protein PL009_00160 [Flavipsychrobacter sp.]|nr:hypothetical protein [Flavipsychrobacter sp.]
MRLFLNPGNTAHLRGLAEDFGESTNAVRLELNRFEEAGMVSSEASGNKKIYKANHQHPLFPDINNILLKYIGIDKVIDTVIHRIGDLQMLFMTGDYALGKDSGIIDLIFVGDLNKQYLLNLVEKAEKLVSKKIRYITYESGEWEREKSELIAGSKVLMIWEKPARSMAILDGSKPGH